MEEVKRTTFAERLKQIRVENNLNQAEFAELTGVGKSMIPKWESGLTEPRASSIDKIAHAVGVKRQWLAYGTGDKTYADTEKRKQEKIKAESHRYKAQDERDLKNIELCIRHLREMNVTIDEKRAIHSTLSKIRSELEIKVVFGIDE